MDWHTRHGIASSDWYRQHRVGVESFFTKERVVSGSDAAHISPSGRYRLDVRVYHTMPGRWNYSRGHVSAGERLVADVRRNLSTFHFGWAEGHMNGHDYFLGGEDYQGQTVVELDTGRRADYLPEQAKSGHGFCCAAYYPSPEGRLIVVEGCYWACPYELVLCRFDDPMTLPWPHSQRVDVTGEAIGWAEGGFVYESWDDVRLPDGTLFEKLTDAEQEDFWARRREVGGLRKRRYLWTPGGDRRLLDDRVVPAPP